jgi:hypothetical protein
MVWLSPIAQAQQEVGGVPVPPIIENDVAAATLFPHLIGLRTAEICHDLGEGVSDEQLETLKAAVAGYANSLAITSLAVAAVRGFANAIVDQQADEMSATEWKQT